MNFRRSTDFNDGVNIAADANSMTCSVLGTIPVGSQRFGNVAATAYESLTAALTTSALDLEFETSVGNNRFMLRIGDTVTPTDEVYFGILVPNDVQGTCSVTATLKAGVDTGLGV